MLRVTAHWERPSLSAGGSKTSFSKSVILKEKSGMGVLAFALYFANVLNMEYWNISIKIQFFDKKNLHALNSRLFMSTFLPPTPQKVKTLP